MLVFEIHASKSLVMLCRVRSSEIIVPYPKFCKSLTQSFSCGMRFKIRFETEDSSERRLVSFSLRFSFLYCFSRLILFGRCSGLIVGVSDVDPGRWPGSKWKCLLVSCWLINAFIPVSCLSCIFLC